MKLVLPPVWCPNRSYYLRENSSWKFATKLISFHMINHHFLVCVKFNPRIILLNLIDELLIINYLDDLDLKIDFVK